jgi:hypothetical protein
MFGHENDMSDTLGTAWMRGGPDPAQMQAVRERMAALAAAPGERHSFAGRVGLTVLTLMVVGTVGLAATDSGRRLLRSIFIPVQQDHLVIWSPTHDIPEPPGGDPCAAEQGGEQGGGTHVVYSTGSNVPLNAEQEESFRSQMREIHELVQSGGGELVGLMEMVTEDEYHTACQIRYTLKDGSSHTVGSSLPEGKQAENMRLEEILELRDAGAGELLSSAPFVQGLGKYKIRFILSDGTTLDLDAVFPPGPRSEREAIVAETRELKRQHLFQIDRPSAAPGEPVYGVLRYALSDGRTVGFVEQVPAEVLSGDGTQVVLPAPNN